MKLYYARGACSLATHIVLYETGQSFTTRSTDTKTKRMDDGSDFFAINPNGYVPVLELDNGERLTEAAVTLQYLAEQHPASGLLPTDGLARYRTLEWLNFVATEVHKSFTPLFTANTPDDYKPVAREKVSKRLAYVNQRLEGHSFLLAEQYTIADPYLFVVSNWARFVEVDLTPFTHLVKYRERVAQRPAVQAAMRAEGLLK
jgi:glutathione S-transferase